MRGIKEKGQIVEVYRKRVLENSSDLTQNKGSNTISPFQGASTGTLSSTTVTASSPSSASPERDISKIARLERMLKSKRLMIS